MWSDEVIGYRQVLVISRLATADELPLHIIWSCTESNSSRSSFAADALREGAALDQANEIALFAVAANQCVEQPVVILRP